ncbi:hypothetical protein [Streptomyces sp. NPDC050564]|uniref:hypothetical protein n=1 Tax=Streptomyces sp. NPDC050564 TaxID=3365631 RepID=UPI00379BEF31
MVTVDRVKLLTSWAATRSRHDRIARMLKDETASGGVVTTSPHPGLVGPGWAPIGPIGNYDPAVWRMLSAEQPLQIPGLGVELIHHVHADEVAS